MNLYSVMCAQFTIVKHVVNL